MDEAERHFLRRLFLLTAAELYSSCCCPHSNGSQSCHATLSPLVRYLPSRIHFVSLSMPAVNAKEPSPSMVLSLALHTASLLYSRVADPQRWLGRSIPLFLFLSDRRTITGPFRALLCVQCTGPPPSLLAGWLVWQTHAPTTLRLLACVRSAAAARRILTSSCVLYRCTTTVVCIMMQEAPPPKAARLANQPVSQSVSEASSGVSLVGRSCSSVLLLSAEATAK